MRGEVFGTGSQTHGVGGRGKYGLNMVGKETHKPAEWVGLKNENMGEQNRRTRAQNRWAFGP